MKIDEACINHNAVKIIDEILTDPYSWCYVDESNDKQDEAYNCMLMAIGNVVGVIEMANVMKEVLRT